MHTAAGIDRSEKVLCIRTRSAKYLWYFKDNEWKKMMIVYYIEIGSFCWVLG